MRTKNNIFSIVVSIISLAVSVISVLFSVFVWQYKNIPRIEISSLFNGIDGSYEEYRPSENDIFGDIRGRFVLSGLVYITNLSSQGCIVDGIPILMESNEIVMPNPSYIFVEGDNMLQRIVLEGESSVVIPIEIYIYVDAESHQMLREEFDVELWNTPIFDLQNFLFRRYNKLIELSPPRVLFFSDESAFDFLPKEEGKLIFCFFSDTGAHDFTVVDYARIDSFCKR